MQTVEDLGARGRSDSMKILVACEESQEVTKELRRLGHEAYSCDIIPCSGGHPEWHLQVNALELLKMKWDMIIAHPPCTFLTVTGNRWFNTEKYGEKAIQRKKDRELAIEFFMKFANADCEKIAIENPIGVMSTIWRKPDQIIQPFEFAMSEAEETVKSTCLWLKGLNPLVPLHKEKKELTYHEWITPNGKKKRQSLWYYKTRCLPNSERARAASKTFHGIAVAMAEQWAGEAGKE